jgi:hypothetical protein
MAREEVPKVSKRKHERKSKEHGAGSTEHGAGSMEHGAWSTEHGAKTKILSRKHEREK